jgi:hypothetical protein
MGAWALIKPLQRAINQMSASMITDWSAPP